MADNPEQHACKTRHTTEVCSGFYGVAFIGAAVYFVQHATSFWGGVLGVLKAIVWPAILIYKVLELLKM